MVSQEYVHPRPSASERRERARRALAMWRQDKNLRQDVTRELMDTFDVWKVSSQEALELLGFSPQSRGQLAGFRQGAHELGRSEDTWRRAMSLLAIQRSLEAFAPDNPEWRDDWVHQPIAGLHYDRPIDIMLADGLAGMERVRRYAKTLGHQ